MAAAFCIQKRTKRFVSFFDFFDVHCCSVPLIIYLVSIDGISAFMYITYILGVFISGVTFLLAGARTRVQHSGRGVPAPGAARQAGGGRDAVQQGGQAVGRRRPGGQDCPQVCFAFLIVLMDSFNYNLCSMIPSSIYSCYFIHVNLFILLQPIRWQSEGPRFDSEAVADPELGASQSNAALGLPHETKA